MTAPQTNLETQARRHRGPLIGMALVVVFAVGLILCWVFQEVATSDPPEPPKAQDSLRLPKESITLNKGATTAP